MPVDSILKAISNPKTKVFRKLWVKRRSGTTGLFETSWQELTVDVKRWGSIKSATDSGRISAYTVSDLNLALDNSSGRYNQESDPNSFWYGYLPPQRSLVRIDAGFAVDTLSAGGIWTRTLYQDPGTVFTGIIYGELFLSDKNEVTVNVKPLQQVFRDYPARNLIGLSANASASGIITVIRDQTDGSGNFVFRPFFGDTTSNFTISPTTNQYLYLSTNTAGTIVDKTTWEVIEKLAEAENHAAFVTPGGAFKFVPRSATTTVAYEFYGQGYYDTTYGKTIKALSKYGFDYDRFYSSVQVKFADADTNTSYLTTSASFAVSAANTAWKYGLRTLKIENLWLADTAAASNIAGPLFTEYSAVKQLVEFKSSFVPHLNLLDRVAVYYDSTPINSGVTLWDVSDWDTELEWDSYGGEAIRILGTNFRFMSMEINLDSFECTYLAREL